MKERGKDRRKLRCGVSLIEPDSGFDKFMDWWDRHGRWVILIGGGTLAGAAGIGVAYIFNNVESNRPIVEPLPSGLNPSDFVGTRIPGIGAGAGGYGLDCQTNTGCDIPGATCVKISNTTDAGVCEFPWTSTPSK